MSLITTVDHNLPEPGSSSKKPTTNPDIAHFMTPNASEDDGIDARDIENVLAVASLFGGIRDRPYMEENETQQRLLDNLISQLLEEANARYWIGLVRGGHDIVAPLSALPPDVVRFINIVQKALLLHQRNSSNIFQL
ncbi:hypothetical protein HK104_008296 [Borealophlyctis nickersoniae]|nr:hypothetical protein HK104_008296 [Borealophlyctis nickersoniae]